MPTFSNALSPFTWRDKVLITWHDKVPRSCARAGERFAAFHTAANGRPGPVVIAIPEDLLVERGCVVIHVAM